MSYFTDHGLNLSLEEEIAFADFLGWNTIPQRQQKVLWDQGVLRIRELIGAVNSGNVMLILAELLEMNVPRFAAIIAKTIIENIDNNPPNILLYVDLATRFNSQVFVYCFIL